MSYVISYDTECNVHYMQPVLNFMYGWLDDGRMTKVHYMQPVLNFMCGWPDDGRMTETDSQKFR